MMHSPKTENSSVCVVGCLQHDPALSRVEKTCNYSYFGAVNTFLGKTAAEFVASVSNADTSKFQNLVEDFLRVSHEDCDGTAAEKAAMWLTIRMSLPCTQYQTPRWHQDGRFYNSEPYRSNVVRRKYAATALGPPTMFLVWNEEVAEYVRSDEWRRGRDPDSEERRKVAEALSKHTLERIDKGQIARFSVGEHDSTVHSEPDMNTDRIFMSVLFGSEAEIRNLCENWQKPYQG